MRTGCVAVAIFLAAPASAGQQFPRAYVGPSDGQIWVQAGDAAPALRVTDDKKLKAAPITSPDGRHVAFAASCMDGGADTCPAEIVVADWSGKVLWRAVDVMQPQGLASETRCAAIDSLVWIDSRRLGSVCHTAPSASIYSVVDFAARRAGPGFPGLDFTWSPDRRHLAQTSAPVRFAPLDEQNQCVLIDHKVASYPGCSNRNDDAPGVRRPGVAAARDHMPIAGARLSANVHAIASLVWSPDSRRLAYIDTISDILAKPRTLDENGASGEFVHARRFLSITGPGQYAKGWWIADDCAGLPVWRDATHVTLGCETADAFDVAHGNPQPVR
jgi:hypothetical protein